VNQEEQTPAEAEKGENTRIDHSRKKNLGIRRQKGGIFVKKGKNN